MKKHVVLRTLLLTGGMIGILGSQGCILAAAGAAGAAGGYEAKEHGYGVQSPVKKDAVGGYKGQSPVTHDQDNSSTTGTTGNGG